MNYEILVEGGFTGIPKKYEGDMALTEERLLELLKLMNASKPSNSNLRDGFLYRVTLFDNDKSIEAQFEEDNLPEAIREILMR
ncbi:MAG: protealysin inhibitor emfourin [Aurantibacter sp.]